MWINVFVWFQLAKLREQTEKVFGSVKEPSIGVDHDRDFEGRGSSGNGHCRSLTGGASNRVNAR
jgi:hypothetical protein